MPTPTSVTELRSFLGMAQYSVRFIPGFATISEPLRRLTKKDCKWRWTSAHEAAFQSIKNSLRDASANTYFDPHKETTVYVDASPVGLAAILTQEGRTVICTSRSLAPVEQRYSQTEREALAVVWACEHLHIYLAGTTFTVVTDHQPLTSIWLKPDPPLRIARWSLRLQSYSPNIIYKPGKLNPADFLSRHPKAFSKASHPSNLAEEHILAVVQHSAPKAVTVDDIIQATAADSTLQAAIRAVQTGRWTTTGKAASPQMKQLHAVRDDLAVYDDSILLRGDRIVIPASLQQKTVDLAHVGHQGISKAKSLMRSKVWLPGMDSLVEKTIKECIPCQANSSNPPAAPLQMSKLPSHAWTDLSVDFLTPGLPTGEYLLVVVDEYSRYPITEFVKSTCFKDTQKALRKIFAVFGFPQQIKTDNGPPFNGSEWTDFMEQCGIHHRKITPLWPKANAQAESFNKPLLKAIRAAYVENKCQPEETLLEFLQAYRATPHASTKFSPYYLMFGRHPLTYLPTITQLQDDHPDDAAARQNDTSAKLRMKSQADGVRPGPSEFTRGDSVLVRKPRTRKIDTRFSPDPLVVTATKGTLVTAQGSDGRVVTRNCSHFKKLPHHPDLLSGSDDEDSDDADHTTEPQDDEDRPPDLAAGPPANPPTINDGQHQASPHIRPRRAARKPRRLIEEIE